MSHLLVPVVTLSGSRTLMHAVLSFAAPNSRLTAEISVISDHGTNTGPLMGMPATGKQATVTGMDITRMANGKVVEHWGQLDMLGLMQQLGVVPMPGQGPT